MAPIFPEEGGSIVAMTFDTSKIFPNYGWMNTGKDLLNSMIRQAAANLGEKGIRVNGISAGPVKTSSGEAIEDFQEMVDSLSQAAPLFWDADKDAKEAIASAARYLLSDESKLLTGNIIYLDGGAHLMMPTDRKRKQSDG